MLISEDDWRSISETLHLSSIPGMVDSIKKGMKEKIEECDEDLDWRVTESFSPNRRRRMQRKSEEAISRRRLQP